MRLGLQALHLLLQPQLLSLQLLLGDVARDAKRWVVTETLSDANANLYLVERGKPDKLVLLTPHQGDVLYDTRGFSRDDKQLYVTSDEGGEFSALYVLDLAKKALTPVLRPSWDVEAAGVSHTFEVEIEVAIPRGNPVTLNSPAERDLAAEAVTQAGLPLRRDIQRLRRLAQFLRCAIPSGALRRHRCARAAQFHRPSLSNDAPCACFPPIPRH